MPDTWRRIQILTFGDDNYADRLRSEYLFLVCESWCWLLKEGAKPFRSDGRLMARQDLKGLFARLGVRRDKI